MMVTKGMKIFFAAAIIALFMLSVCPMTEAIEGGQASHFILNDVRGVKYDLRAVIGKKPLLIIFSATWCPACNENLPAFKQLYQLYAPRGVEIISIDLEEPTTKVAAWIAAKNGVPYRVLIDETGAVGRAYNILGIPGLVLFNKRGEVVCNPCRSFDEVHKVLK